MGKNQMESENVSSKDFGKERIKARPVNRAKLIRKMVSFSSNLTIRKHLHANQH